LEGTKDRNWLHSSILDKIAFNECIKILSDKNSPGQNGIFNEFVCMFALQRSKITLHMLLIIMWASGFIPGKLLTPSLFIRTKEMKLGVLIISPDQPSKYHEINHTNHEIK
jgi:hypothetical protein